MRTNPSVKDITNSSAETSLKMLRLLVVLQSRAKDSLEISNMVHQYTNEQIKKISPKKPLNDELNRNKSEYLLSHHTSSLRRQIGELDANESVKLKLDRFCLSLADINNKIKCLALIIEELDSILVEHMELFSLIEEILGE